MLEEKVARNENKRKMYKERMIRSEKKKSNLQNIERMKLEEKQRSIVRTLRIMDDEMGRLWKELDEIEYKYSKNNYRNKKCYKCREKGHIKANCPNNR